MTTVVIVESPAKCQKLEKYLGSGYRVMASYGHLTTLSDLKNIDISNNFRPHFTPIESKVQHIIKLQRAVNSASKVIIATDDDREGEAIGWHICRLFKLPVTTTERIIFHEITETAVKRAIQNPTTLNMATVYSQQARQILDLLVGYKISPILWKNILTNTKNALSAGRCQTPALRLIYDNYLDIEQSPGKTSYNTQGYFTSKNIEFSLNYDFDTSEKVENFLETSINFQHRLSRESERNINKSPPEPFITSTIQQIANNLMHISPKETMKICQRLYEQGYITYMRTDCKVYSKEFIDTVIPYIDKNYSSKHIHLNIDRLWDREKMKDLKIKKESKKKSDKKTQQTQDLAQEAHEAIRPTKIQISEIPEDEEFTNKERRLYKIIWTNTIQSCMSDAEYKTFQVRITAPENLYYKYTTELCIFRGWQEVDWKETINYFEFLRIIKEGNIDYKKLTSRQTIKDKKTHYTEAKLVQLLEHNGIGRPSTFSSIVDKILERKYVNIENIEGKKIQIKDYEVEDDRLIELEGEREFGNEKKKLVLKPIGILVIEFMLKNFPEICDYEYTKIMEQDLDKIAKGETEYYKLCSRVNSLIDKTIKDKELDKNNKISIKIDENHTYIIGKNGPVIKCNIDKTTTFKSIKSELVNKIDMCKLENGGYKLEELIDIDKTSKINQSKNLLGKYRNEDVYIRTGKYGLYIEWGTNRKSMKAINKSINNITIEDAINVIENKICGDVKNIVREIDKNMNIRNGKFGDYLYYKTETMKRPEFLKIITFPGDYKNCNINILRNWIKETHYR